eukprot:13255982-Alexandrium_andersonii.AAC.1
MAPGRGNSRRGRTAGKQATAMATAALRSRLRPRLRLRNTRRRLLVLPWRQGGASSAHATGRRSTRQSARRSRGGGGRAGATALSLTTRATSTSSKIRTPARKHDAGQSNNAN